MLYSYTYLPTFSCMVNVGNIPYMDPMDLAIELVSTSIFCGEDPKKMEILWTFSWEPKGTPPYAAFTPRNSRP